MKELFVKVWKKLTTREMIMYIIFGVATTVINYVTDLIAYHFLDSAKDSLPTLLSSNTATTANVIAWVVAVIFAFFVNKIFVFESKSWAIKVLLYEFWTFMAARVLSLLFEMGFIWIFVDRTGIMPNWIAKILSNVVVIIVNYIFSKLIIFRKKKGE